MNQETITRDWNLYNQAQTQEKLIFLRIIDSAVNSLCIPHKYQGNGRPTADTSIMIKACLIKVFNCFSARRTVPDMELSKAMGYLYQVPAFNTIIKYMGREELMPWLDKLYQTLALPFNKTEDTFAIDGTGFSTFTKKQWIEYKTDFKCIMDFKKLHVVNGVKTGIITACKVTEGRVHDSRCFEELVRKTRQRFHIKKLCGDPGYMGRKNAELVSELGGQPFLLPAQDRKRESYYGRSLPTHKFRNAWSQMVKMWIEDKENFMTNYHQRSTVESVFSAVKRKFLPYVRSKTYTAQINELLCKVCCHNASVLVNAMFARGINPQPDWHQHG